MDNNLSTQQMNPVYQAFSEPGFHWGLFLPALIFAILAMIGLPLNASLCWVTVKYRSSLRYNTCILLALEGFFRILHQFGHFHFFIIALSGINFYPIRLALPLQSYSAIGNLAGMNLVALLSLDRLFSVLAPLFYRQLNQRVYIFCHLLVNAGITSFYFVQMVQSANVLPEWPCTGSLHDFFALPSVGPTLFSLALGLNCATILAYLFVAIIVKLKTGMF